MRTFGGFRSGDEFFYGELRGDQVHRLALPYWIDTRATGDVLPLADLQIAVPVAPSKLIAVGLNYADHIAERRRVRCWHITVSSKSRFLSTKLNLKLNWLS
jgi:2-keto-4-pentenoate hydratase/2-oxohepta-3-ene-1,7-dioic acid hydratase in catechol pathway